MAINSGSMLVISVAKASLFRIKIKIIDICWILSVSYQYYVRWQFRKILNKINHAINNISNRQQAVVNYNKQSDHKMQEPNIKIKKLLLTKQTITKQGIVNITDTINKTNAWLKNKNTIIMPVCWPDDQELNLKFNLLLNGNSNSNLNLNLRSNDNENGENYLVVLGQDQDQRQDPQRVYFSGLNDWGVFVAVVVIYSGEGIFGGADHIYKKPVFRVRSLKQTIEIVCMNQQQLNRRRKLESMLLKSQIKYKNRINLQQFKKIVQSFIILQTKADLKQISRKLSFYVAKRRKTIKPFFMHWLIFHYQHQIQQKQTEIIQGNYILYNSSRRIKQKCFKAWKNLKKIYLLNKN